jgi:hypothetical protein
MAPKELADHYKWLASFKGSDPGKITGEPPEGYENYHVVDVFGDEFVWMNDSFTKDKFTWYVWYESVFLVPEEMLAFLMLRWS